MRATHRPSVPLPRDVLPATRSVSMVRDPVLFTHLTKPRPRDTVSEQAMAELGRAGRPLAPAFLSLQQNSSITRCWRRGRAFRTVLAAVAGGSVEAHMVATQAFHRSNATEASGEITTIINIQFGTRCAVPPDKPNFT